MARTRNPVTVLGPDGRPLAGAQVYTRTRPGGADATVYAAETGAGAGVNPATTDSSGRVTQWLERGAYASTVTATGLTPFVEPWDSAPAGDGTIDTGWYGASTVTAAKVDLPGVAQGMMLSGLYSARPGAAAPLNGFSYLATDKLMEWRCVAAAWVLTQVFAPEVTALPASPIDQQECVLIHDAATTVPAGSVSGAKTHYRYRAASANAAKWEALGDPAALFAQVQMGAGAASEGIVSSTYGTLATAGPSITAPLAGDYLVEWGCRASVSGGANGAFMSLSIGGATATDDLAADANSGYEDAVMRRQRMTLAASAVVVARYRGNNTNTSYFRDRWLSLKPLRVG